jgi:hypothetical protein
MVKMARSARSVVADRIRIEDEVWDEAFTTRVPSRPPRTRRALTAVPSERSTQRRIDAPMPSRRAEPERPQPVSAVVPLRPVPAPAADTNRGRPANGPRTVRIQGRGAERHLPVTSSRQRPRRAHESAYFRPDKLAMWAVLLGFLLVAAAVLSPHA